MNLLRKLFILFALLLFSPGARGGLYYSGEVFAELPSQWRGFLLDQRTLRGIAVKPDVRNPASPARLRYQEAAGKLEKLARQGQLTADDIADLGALYIRLGEVDKAVEFLRAGQRQHGKHFQIVSNLGTAYQLQGDLLRAAACLHEAVRLAPGKLQKAEEYQLKLVRFRQKRPRDRQELDDLFGVRYESAQGRYEPGKLAPAQRKKLPARAAAVVQQLGLWLPADGRVLWQLAELANSYGDVRTAAAMMDGCVTQFGLKDPVLRHHRQVLRAAAGELSKMGPSKADHRVHRDRLPARSRRPLLSRLGGQKLPPISDQGINALPWSVLAETALDRRFRPTFAKYLKQLDGKSVELAGFMQPLGEGGEATSFMLIEYPVGCWYCEMPEMTGIVLVELTGSKPPTFTRSLVKVVGKLTLNGGDPENFLYTIGKARVAQAD